MPFCVFKYLMIRFKVYHILLKIVSLSTEYLVNN